VSQNVDLSVLKVVFSLCEEILRPKMKTILFWSRCNGWTEL